MNRAQVIKSVLKDLCLRVPFMTALIGSCFITLIASELFLVWKCTPAEREQLDNMCVGSIAPGPADPCEIFPPCVASPNEDFPYMIFSLLCFLGLRLILWIVKKTSLK
jgi:hypothetical protein